MTCTHHSQCPLFAQFAMEPALKLWKQHFCDNVFNKCARYQLSLSGKPVPLNLLPNGKLIEKKVRSSEEVGGTALFNAILKKRAPMVRSMLKTQTATSSIMSQDGMTPLMAAASVASPEIIEIVLEFGCNPFNVNQDGKMAIDIARDAGCDECVSVLQQFMEKNSSLKNAAMTLSKENIDVEQAANESKSFFKDMVGLLKKLNPLSK